MSRDPTFRLATEPSPDHRLADIRNSLERLKKTDILSQCAVKPGGTTSGGMHFKRAKRTAHRNPNSAYDAPFYSRPFFHAESNNIQANISEIMFGHVMHYLNPGSTAKSRIGKIGKKPYFFSKEIPRFVSSHVASLKKGTAVSKELYNQSTAEFLSTAMLIGDPDFNRENYGVSTSRDGKVHFSRFDLELAGFYDSFVTILDTDTIDIFIQTKNYFRMLLLNAMKHGGCRIEAGIATSIDFANAARRLQVVNLDHIRMILTESFNAALLFIGPEIAAKGKKFTEFPPNVFILKELNEAFFLANLIEDEDLNLASLVERIISEIRQRLEQLRIWSELIDLSLSEGVAVENIKERILALPVVGEEKLVAQLKSIFIDLYKVARREFHDLEVSNGISGVINLLQFISEADVADDTDRFVFDILEEFKYLDDEVTLDEFYSQCEEIEGGDDCKAFVIKQIKDFCNGEVGKLSFARELSVSHAGAGVGAGAEDNVKERCNKKSRTCSDSDVDDTVGASAGAGSGAAEEAVESCEISRTSVPSLQGTSSLGRWTDAEKKRTKVEGVERSGR